MTSSKKKEESCQSLSQSQSQSQSQSHSQLSLLQTLTPPTPLPPHHMNTRLSKAHTHLQQYIQRHDEERDNITSTNDTNDTNDDTSDDTFKSPVRQRRKQASRMLHT